MRLHRTAILIACLAQAGLARAEPSDYLVSLPPPWTLRLELPPISAAALTNAGAAADAAEPSVRRLRDEALLAYEKQDYRRTIKHLDDMEAVAPLPPTLRLLRAWCATYAGEDERASDLWGRLAAAATNHAQYAFMAGWHDSRLGYYRQAHERLARALALNPHDRDTLHMAGVGAWGAGRKPAAQRLLVQAMRSADPLPESFFAMAAVLVADDYAPAAVGWVRKGLALLPESHRAYWIVKDDFAPLWARGEPSWLAVLSEFKLPADRDAAAAAAAEYQPPPSLRPPPAPTAPRQTPELLNLSTYSRDPSVRLRQVHTYRLQRTMERLDLNAAEETGTNLLEGLEGALPETTPP